MNAWMSIRQTQWNKAEFDNSPKAKYHGPYRLSDPDQCAGNVCYHYVNAAIVGWICVERVVLFATFSVVSFSRLLLFPFIRSVLLAVYAIVILPVIFYGYACNEWLHDQRVVNKPQVCAARGCFYPSSSC